MFTTKSKEDPQLTGAIDDLFAELSALTGDDPQYAKTADQLVKLYELREKTTSKRHVSPDTLALVLGNLAGIAMIVGHERTGIVTSKAVGFVLRAMK